MPDSRPPFRNRLLAKLSRPQLASLEPLEPVDLPLRHSLEYPNTIVSDVYFLEDGVASVVAQTEGRREIEVGLIGREGMTGLALMTADDRSPFETFMQVEGGGYRVPAGRLLDAVAGDDTMRRDMLRYVRVFHLQVAATSIANGNSKLEERLARWVLMVADRVGPSFHITHEFLATMLAVRRAGVTLGLQVLEGRGLIRSGRGVVTILDRTGLITAANGAYGMSEGEYERLLGETAA